MSPGREHLGTRRCVGHFTITQEQLADLGGAWRDLVREIERDIRPKWLSGEWFRTTRYPYTLYFRPNITDTTFRNEQHLRGGMTPKDFLISGPFHRMVIYEPNFVQLDLDLRLLQKQLGDEVSPIILAGAITEYPLEMWVRSLDRPHHELLQWKERSVSHFMDRKLSRLATQWRNKETGVPPDSLAINRWHQEFQENKEHIAKDARNWGDDIQAHCAAIEERLRQGARDVETRGRSLFESGVHQLRPEWSRESPGEVHTLPSDILDHCRRLNTSVDSKPHGGVGYPSLPPSPDPLSKSSISWSELVGSVLLVWVLYHLVRLFFRIHPVQRIPGEHLDWSRSLGHSQPQSGRGVHGVDSTGVSSHPSTKGRSIKTTSATIGNATTATMDRPQSTASDDHGTGPTLQANTLQDPLGLPADGTALTGQWSHLRDILVHFPILILLVTVLEMNHYSTLLSGYLLAVFGCGALLYIMAGRFTSYSPLPDDSSDRPTGRASDFAQESVRTSRTQSPLSETMSGGYRSYQNSPSFAVQVHQTSDDETEERAGFIRNKKLANGKQPAHHAEDDGGSDYGGSESAGFYQNRYDQPSPSQQALFQSSAAVSGASYQAGGGGGSDGYFAGSSGAGYGRGLPLDSSSTDEDGYYGRQEGGRGMVRVNRYETSLPLRADIEAALAYPFGCVSGVVLLILEQKNDYVRFHAWQSCLFSTVALLALVLVGLISTFLYWVLLLLFIGALLALTYRAYRDGSTLDRYFIPHIGPYADAWVNSE
ncbi:hypothetical protein IWQ62_005242 [Dispira parvispora]|uniref:Uncharacterized protein n=1 Tax=Dispira parvispora TaxID=1520584 RepID=A0A9W8DZU8_9FUNG|nr:hypothetical protein IWQ62_005242 [Dispira parvispora]